MSRVTSKPPVLPPLLIHNSPYSGIKDIDSSVWSLTSTSDSTTSTSSTFSSSTVTPQQSQQTNLRDTRIPFTLLNNNINNSNNNAKRRCHLTRNSKPRTCKELWNLPWMDKENGISIFYEEI
ncbi:1700_t:CDS:2 [Diversispora eburnea]|uniref:1700_t:CDS:1 n=1 Tax=Diversispora eburnea TaxID=1213867 RepID=A0A9N8Z926_9GLOM|nr:1700_t:CDS:2 [Diversispora eburnea]